MVRVVRKENPNIKKVFDQLDRKQISVGYFPDARYPDGTPVAYVAAIQEFGSPSNNIPARPTIRPTQQAQQHHVGQQLAGAIKGAIAGQVDLHAAMEAIGMEQAGEIGKAISRVSTPPLKESTLKARQYQKKTKGVSTKPLVHTGLMIQSVTSVVENKK